MVCCYMPGNPHQPGSRLPYFFVEILATDPGFFESNRSQVFSDLLIANLVTEKMKNSLHKAAINFFPIDFFSAHKLPFSNAGLFCVPIYLFVKQRRCITSYVRWLASYGKIRHLNSPRIDTIH